MWREEQAQATLELALVLPVLIVVGLIVYNLMTFNAAVARFDRVVPDIVLAHGSSPRGDEHRAFAGATSTIQHELIQALEPYEVEIEVSARDIGAGPQGTSLLSLVGSLCAYTCRLKYRPWPQGLVLAGIRLGAPDWLVHTREVVVDPWRPGALV
ncbi:hypothetical protein KPC83_06395 [Collinsella sp. zg1085]|nr:hypothetical protein KPC83_06395 [Collinsella sp. zg1085]